MSGRSSPTRSSRVPREARATAPGDGVTRIHAAVAAVAAVAAWSPLVRGADAVAPPPPAAPAPAAPAPAPGADQIQFAARELDLGYRAYMDKQYDQAATHFENAFFAAPNPAELSQRRPRAPRRGRARARRRWRRSASGAFRRTRPRRSSPRTRSRWRAPTCRSCTSRRTPSTPSQSTRRSSREAEER